MSQRNLQANNQRKSSISVFLRFPSDDAHAPAAIACSHPTEHPSDLLLSSPSPSGASQAIFRNGGGGDSSLILQHLRGTQGVVSELHVPKTLHGSLVNDGYFATGCSWRIQEDAICFTAEVTATEKTPSWGVGSDLSPGPNPPIIAEGPKPSSSEPRAGPKTWKGVGALNEDWGELNTGKRPPGVYCWDLVTKEVVKVPFLVKGPHPTNEGEGEGEGDDEEWSFGQPVWTRDGSGVLAVAWEHRSSNFPSLAGKRLGVVFCYNRPCRILYLPVKREGGDRGQLLFGPCQDLTSSCNHSSALSPTFNPDGSSLFFISQDMAVRSGTHGATAKLCSLLWPPTVSSSASQVLIDVVSRSSEPDGFPGLYSSAMIDEPFADQGRLLLINTQWQSVTCIIAVSTSDGRVWPLSPHTGAQPKSYSLSAIHGNIAYAVCVSPLEPPHIVCAALPTLPSLSSSSSSVLTWTPINLDPEGNRGSISDATQSLLSSLDYSVAKVKPTAGYGDDSLTFESILIFPRREQGSKDPLPTLIVPHGGPHTAMSIGWYPSYAFLASLGFLLICPNYRGSTGFGQDSLASLPGRIGTNDVQDCMAALEQAIDGGLADKNRVAVVGGSHGGFLTAHLLGQHPDIMKAGVLRNPVCNLSLMVGVSDISDWCWIEAFGTEEGKRRASLVPKPEDLAHLFSVSPIAHIDKVKAPMLFLLGAKDRRVPLVDGMQYLAALKTQGASEAARRPRVITFPEDGHGLEKPQSEFENWLNAASWLKKHFA